MNGAEPDAGDGIRPHDACLKLGDLRQSGVDAVLDCADLGCDFKGGVFNLLFAHGYSSSAARDRGEIRLAGTGVGLAASS